MKRCVISASSREMAIIMMPSHHDGVCWPKYEVDKISSGQCHRYNG